MTTCPSSSRKSPPSCSGDQQNSWPASRLKLGQRVETSSNSSSERDSRTSTNERSFTSRSSDIVILCAKQKTDYPLLRGSRLRYWLPPLLRRPTSQGGLLASTLCLTLLRSPWNHKVLLGASLNCSIYY